MSYINAIGAAVSAPYNNIRFTANSNYVSENSIMNQTNATNGTNGELDRISISRLAFNLLSDEQIKEINETRMLPKNAKFVPDGRGGYIICNNFFNFRAGTQVLPEGFEVKRDILGFAVVVPKGTDGAFIKNA